MNFNPSNFLYYIKQLVTGRNGDDVPVAPQGQSTPLSSATSSDGGIKHDVQIQLSDVTGANSAPVITDSTGGTPSATFAAITAGSTYAQADIVAIKNALSEIALILNARAFQASSVPALSIPAGTNQPIGTVTFLVPRDYDEASDHFTVHLLIACSNSADNTAGLTVTGTPTIQPFSTGTATTGAAVSAIVPFTTGTATLSTTEQDIEVNLSGNGLLRNSLISVALALSGTNADPVYVYGLSFYYDSTIVSYNETDATDNPSNTTSLALTGFGNPLR